MEAAAKQVKLLSQRILPDRPHHLSFSPDARYTVPSDDQGPEEHIHRRLQYMTFVSDGDRGLLLTRPYYEMREEPPTSSAKEKPALSRSEKKPAMKMSLSDYKNKVKQKSQSPLPFPGGRPIKPEEGIPKSTQERKKDASQSFKDPRVTGSRDPLFNDRPSSLPPKPPPIRGPSPSPCGRKRGSDEDETPRPPKRTKADMNGGPDERSRASKDYSLPRGGSEGSRKKDSTTGWSNIHDRADGKAGMATSTMNGRSMLKAAMSSAHNGSPNARSRAGSLNGSRPESNGGQKSAPVKPSPSLSGAKATIPPLLSPLHKTTVPPLLSPLHLSFDVSPDTKKTEKASRRNDQPDSQRSAKTKSDRPVPTKKAKSPVTIPPLLSPTLPPIVEEELLRRKKATSKASGSKSPEYSRNMKKPQATSRDSEQPKKESFMVTLKYPKRLSKRVQRLLALPGKNDRAGSSEKQQPPQTSKKRPLQSGGPPEITGEALNLAAIGMKRPRKSEAVVAAKAAPTPSTPSRPPSAMGHVDTPGESGTASSQPSLSLSRGQVPTSLGRLRQRAERYQILGTKLKHARDDIVKRFPANQVPDAEHKLAVVTGIEATLSYMVGFRSLFEVRQGENKLPDAGVWRSLVPFVLELQRQARKLPFVYALILVLHDSILQEMLTCFFFGDLRGEGATGELQKTGTSQFGLRKKLQGVYKQAEESGSKLPVLNAGVSFDEGICRALGAMTAWAEGESLEWKASLSADEVLAGT